MKKIIAFSSTLCSLLFAHLVNAQITINEVGIPFDELGLRDPEPNIVNPTIKWLVIIGIIIGLVLVITGIMLMTRRPKIAPITSSFPNAPKLRSSKKNTGIAMVVVGTLIILASIITLIIVGYSMVF